MSQAFLFLRRILRRLREICQVLMSHVGNLSTLVLAVGSCVSAVGGQSVAWIAKSVHLFSEHLCGKSGKVKKSEVFYLRLASGGLVLRRRCERQHPTNQPTKPNQTMKNNTPTTTTVRELNESPVAFFQSVLMSVIEKKPGWSTGVQKIIGASPEEMVTKEQIAQEWRDKQTAAAIQAIVEAVNVLKNSQS
jgi:hypothetical protein